METRMIWANLVSGDIERTAAFYMALGFKRNEGYETDKSVSFNFGQNNFIINFFTEERLSRPMNGSLSLSRNANEMIFSLSADSREEVDEWLEKVKAAQGTVVDFPRDFEKGYTFAFADPDNHKFNVLYWPGM